MAARRKNPVFVAADANIDLAAKRTVWGRMMNAGQQCIAPDYVLIEESVEEAFLDRCRHYVREFYGPDPKNNHTVGRIVNGKHFERLQTVLATHGGTVVVGGDVDADQRYIAPTVIAVARDSPAMAEETFGARARVSTAPGALAHAAGPILLVATVPDIETAIRHVAARPKPLSLYIFASSERTQEMILQNTSAGGVSINGAREG